MRVGRSAYSAGTELLYWGESWCAVNRRLIEGSNYPVHKRKAWIEWLVWPVCGAHKISSLSSEDLVEGLVQIEVSIRIHEILASYTVLPAKRVCSYIFGFRSYNHFFFTIKSP